MLFLTFAIGVLSMIAVIVAGLCIYASTKPGDFSVKRSLVIQAPPEKIFPLIDDLKAWEAWSPFEKLDSAMKKEYSGPASGVGATYSWYGNKKAGIGKMEITSSTEPTRIEMALHFDKPFKCDNVVEFTLVPSGTGTEVTWDMRGPQAFIGKLIGIFMDVEKMVGKSFEEGLVSLKGLAEKPS